MKFCLGGKKMEVTGTLINYYFHCKRQCWLHGNKLNFEDNSELVKIGKALHNEKLEGNKDTEISVEGIKIDKINSEYVIEYKKSDSDLNAAKWQLIYYLYKLKLKGIFRDGKLIVFEKKNGNRKTHTYVLTEDLEKSIMEIEESIKELLYGEIPETKYSSKCKNCAYEEYCKS